MKMLNVLFDACRIKKSEMISTGTRCLPVSEQIVAARCQGYDSVYASVNLPFDEQAHTIVLKHVQELRAYDPAMLIVIGIGGSNLGTMAVQEACLGMYCHVSDMCVRYVDTVDSDMVFGILEQADFLLQAGRKVLINIVTKSGTTTETIANGAIFIELLKTVFSDILW